MKNKNIITIYITSYIIVNLLFCNSLLLAENNKIHYIARDFTQNKIVTIQNYILEDRTGVRTEIYIKAETIQRDLDLYTKGVVYAEIDLGKNQI